MTAELLYRGVNPHELTLYDCVAFIEELPDLVERDHELDKAAVAEPLNKIIGSMFGMGSSK